jgi:hypothetical protein
MQVEPLTITAYTPTLLRPCASDIFYLGTPITVPEGYTYTNYSFYDEKLEILLTLMLHAQVRAPVIRSRNFGVNLNQPRWYYSGQTSIENSSHALIIATLLEDTNKPVRFLRMGNLKEISSLFV